MSISTSYWTTVWRWLRGWGRFGEIRFKPGWSARSPAWWLVYGLDIGAAVIVLGVGCQPISRWAGEREHQPWIWIARVLNRWDDGHTDSAGPLMWDTAPCPGSVRAIVMIGWAFVLLVWATW